MPLYAHIINDSPVKIWGLTSPQRKIRVLKGAGVTNIVDDIATVPENTSILLIRGDYLFDDRVVNYMVQTPDIILKVPQGSAGAFVAAHVASGQAVEACEAIAKNITSPSLTGLKTETLETLSVSFQQRLLKFEPPFVLPITSENSRVLERRLFDWSYKGVTDLVTKWAWPRPAQWVVGRCVRHGLRPNHVTIIGLLLAILAGLLFAYGWYGWGLLAGWLMTFLDTVDGKLARVTVTSSKFGHYFDHIIDLIHPPVWYILWGLGLGVSHYNFSGLSLGVSFWLIVIGYVVGRLVEGAFLAWLGKFGLFCWRPIDSYFRLITARRNPCLILLTAGVLLGRPDWGLFAVTIWTMASSVFLVARLSMAVNARLTAGPIQSWFSDIDQADQRQPLAVRLFTHRAVD
ncbi:CDP-alcohol phosphatidyltransferase [Olavius sp. associated proteobacterium Delta 1]|nr:CDP-alcohol phosphatidyltransferase [Olavius sp. associated proteobacterium Delta 1]